jgi:hypothetical protein
MKDIMADLFNIPRATNRVIRSGALTPAEADALGSTAVDTAAPGQVGAFITPQTLVTFPGASTVVTVVWKLLGTAIPSWHDVKLVLFVIALIVGMLIYLLSDDKGNDVKSKVSSFIIALLNSFMLAAAALGIDVAADSAG